MIRRVSAGAVVAAMAIALPASGAEAAQMNVVQAIKSQDKTIRSNPEYKQLKDFKIKTIAEAKRAIPKFKSFEGALRTAANDVSSSTATAKQRTGKRDWVHAAREDANAVGELVTALNDIVKNDATAAKAASAKADKLIAAANKLGAKADKLLGLPKND